MTNSRLTDPEVLEWRFPVLLDGFAIRRGSGGGGAHHGGDGVVRRVRFLEPMTRVILANRRRVAPFGLEGGEVQPAGAELGGEDRRHTRREGRDRALGRCCRRCLRA